MMLFGAWRWVTLVYKDSEMFLKISISRTLANCNFLTLSVFKDHCNFLEHKYRLLVRFLRQRNSFKNINIKHFSNNKLIYFQDTNFKIFINADILFFYIFRIVWLVLFNWSAGRVLVFQSNLWVVIEDSSCYVSLVRFNFRSRFLFYLSHEA